MNEVQSSKLAPKQELSIVKGRSKKSRPKEVNVDSKMECQVDIETTCQLRTPERICSESALSSNKIDEVEEIQKCQALFEKRSSSYDLDPSLLSGTAVTPLMRALLNNWLALSCSESLFTRETFALTTYYVDMYIRENKNVTKNDLQLLGVAALFLASKLEESKIPGDRDQLFRKPDILRVELEICLALKFRLNPDSYIHILNNLMTNWDIFVEEKGDFLKIRYFNPDRQGYQHIRTAYDLADCFNLDAKSLEFNRQDLMVNLLYILTRKFQLELSLTFKTLFDFQNAYLIQDSFRQKFIEYLSSIDIGQSVLSKKIVRYMYPFIALPINFDNRSRSDVPSYSEYVSIQNYNKESFPLVKSIIESRKK